VGLSLTGCATTSGQGSYISPAQGGLYNSVGTSVSERLTTIKISGDVLDIYVLPWSGSQSDPRNTFSFKRESAPQAIAAIEKFMQWYDQAVQRGDQLDKDIASMKAGFFDYEVTFSFFSGNKTNHYLLLSTCDLIGCHTNAYFDYDNAVELKKLFEAFSRGEARSLHSTDTSAYQ
ncbi:MAG: hypothetical protein SVC26_09960, partial [Pseudomonadota bacterium]|nr:hypothetical protein [Pseudomonadota bacterium]